MKRAAFTETDAYVRILGRRSHRHLTLTPGSPCWCLVNDPKTVPGAYNCLYRRATVLAYSPGDTHIKVQLDADTLDLTVSPAEDAAPVPCQTSPAAESVQSEILTQLLPLDRVLEAEEDYLYNDTAEMKVLNYPNVLENIRQRFFAASAEDRIKIYTYAGWVLFAVNPYEPCDALYTDHLCERYYRKTITQEPPHPFALASTAFGKLITDEKSQYILISGESGGGKTECSKHVLKYLTWVTRRQRRQKGRVSIGGPGDAAEKLASLLIDANPLLEFFGNAKTARNDNSSRFGKLFQLGYDAPGEHLLSAHLSTYLLAKSRVVQVPAGEENYHVFHSLMHGLDDATRAALLMQPDFTSPFLGDQAQKENRNVPYHYREDGPFHYSHLVEALAEFGISDDQRMCILKLLASILHLGNLQFEPLINASEGGSEIRNPELCVFVCKLWGMSLDNCNTLQQVLTSKQIRDTRSRLRPDQCRATVYSLCKGLYELLFFHVVDLVQRKLRYTESQFDNGSSLASGTSPSPCIGVLDLFGFENMEPGSRNGFEQLCINYANEQLHYHFMTEVVERELDIYRSEGISVKPKVLFNDLTSLMNQDVLLILLGVKGQRPGLFAILEDVTKLGGSGRDRNFCRRANELIQTHYQATGSNNDGSPSRKRKHVTATSNASAGAPGGATMLAHQFKIDHFAEPVLYTSDGFSDRNQDYMSEEVRAFLSGSKGTFLHQILTENEHAEASARSLCGVFIKQMGSLMSTLENTSCYFIRCLKPNDKQEAFAFDGTRVLKQLVTGGVGPVLELMKEGYPCRLTYDSLWQKFRDYLPAQLQKKLTPRDFGDLALSYMHVNPEAYSLGTTRVFFKFGILQLVQSIMQDLTEEQMADFAVQVNRHQIVIKLVRCVCACIVARKLRANATRLRYRRIAKEAAQAYETVYMPRRREAAACKIQRYMLSIPERFYFFAARRYCISIQRAVRQHLQWSQLLARERSIRLVHAAKGVEALLLRLKYSQQRRGVLKMRALVRIQAAWRGYKTRKLLLEQIKLIQAKRILFAYRRYKLRKALRRVTQRLTKPPAALEQWASPIRPPVDPEARSVVRARTNVLMHRRNSIAYQDTRTFWELSAVNPAAAPETIGGEVRRRRRSIFCQVSTSPRIAHEVVDAVSPLSRQISTGLSPTFGSCYSPAVDEGSVKRQATAELDCTEKSRSVRNDKRITEETSAVRKSSGQSSDNSSLKRSRRCIESATRFGGIESHAVVDLLAKAMQSSHTVHQQPLAGRLSVGDLSAPSIPEEEPPSEAALSEQLLVPQASKPKTMGNHLSCRTLPAEEVEDPLSSEREKAYQLSKISREEATTTADAGEPSPIEPLQTETSNDAEAGGFGEVRRSKTSPNVVLRSEPPAQSLMSKVSASLFAGSRLSIKAWRGEVERELSEVTEKAPRPSFSCSMLNPGHPSRRSSRSTESAEEPPSTPQPETSTPLFGHKKPQGVTSRAKRAETSGPTIVKLGPRPPKGPPMQRSSPKRSSGSRSSPSKPDQDKENTPRPRQTFCLPRKPQPSSRLPMKPVKSALLCTRVAPESPMTSRIPKKPASDAPVKVIKLTRSWGSSS